MIRHLWSFEVISGPILVHDKMASFILDFFWVHDAVIDLLQGPVSELAVTRYSRPAGKLRIFLSEVEADSCNELKKDGHDEEHSGAAWRPGHDEQPVDAVQDHASSVPVQEHQRPAPLHDRTA